MATPNDGSGMNLPRFPMLRQLLMIAAQIAATLAGEFLESLLSKKGNPTEGTDEVTRNANVDDSGPVSVRDNGPVQTA